MSDDRPTSRADEMMTVAAARCLADGAVCFVGIGLPSHRGQPGPPHCTPRPRARLRVGHARRQAGPPAAVHRRRRAGRDRRRVVSVPEMFNYWLQPGRIDVGFLGAAQIDRFANINTTVIGDYDATEGAPARRRRRPGDRRLLRRGDRDAAPQPPRAFVDRVDFVTSVGFGDGPGNRERLGLRGRGPRRRHRPRRARARPGHLRADADRAAARGHRRRGPRATGWDLAVADDVEDVAAADRRGARRAASSCRRRSRRRRGSTA